MLRRVAAALCVVLACTAPAQAAERIYTPAQAAYLKAEIRWAQERFVDRVAAICGLPRAKVKQWVPTDGRDVPPKVNMVSGLARERGKPFTEEERASLLAADMERYKAIELAKDLAVQK